MWTTTLNKIREHYPCADGWAKLLAYLGKTEADDDPLAITTILDSNGLGDALWALRAADCHEAEIRLFVCDCVERALLREREEGREPHADSWRAIEVSRRYAAGKADAGELAAACDAAWAVAWDAVRDAAVAAARASAVAAARASAVAHYRASACDAECEWQAERLRQYASGEVTA